MSATGRITYRRAEDADLPSVLELCRLALKWSADPRNEQLFRWKHRENPFGPSPMWLAESDGKVVGFRAMMRWRFERQGALKHAVRAVDTATHPSFQRRGIFKELNALAIESLSKEGVDFVFNTPNAESLPGYLKQGWVTLGRVPIVARPTGLRGLLVMPSAFGKATKWSEQFDGGQAVDPSRPFRAPCSRWSTDTSSAFFGWRYARGPVAYRAMTDDEGGFIFRIRTRGFARELVVAHSWGAEPTLRRLLREAARVGRVSYSVATAQSAGRSSMLPLPPIGPHLTVRALAAPRPTLDELHLMLGDIELF